MLGKPEWFGRRKYTGWGLTPRTWQGWAYILVLIIPIVAVQSVASLSGELKLWLTIAWAVFFCIDFVDIMRRLPKDERDRMHEALAERNALWVMVLVLGLGIAYQAAQSVVAQGNKVDPVILMAIFAGLAAKALTNYYLDKKD